MGSASLLLHLRRELAAFRDCLEGEVAAPVRHCGDWTLLEPAEHLGVRISGPLLLSRRGGGTTNRLPRRAVGFWQRRRCLEVLVHRWDAELALGAPGSLDAELAGEGIAEVFDAMAPRQIARGRARSPKYAQRLAATDTGESWTYGPGAPVATLAAPAGHLLLLLWGRMPIEGETFAWGGDRKAGLKVLGGALTP